MILHANLQNVQTIQGPKVLFEWLVCHLLIRSRMLIFGAPNLCPPPPENLNCSPQAYDLTKIRHYDCRSAMATDLEEIFNCAMAACDYNQEDAVRDIAIGSAYDSRKQDWCVLAWNNGCFQYPGFFLSLYVVRLILLNAWAEHDCFTRCKERMDISNLDWMGVRTAVCIAQAHNNNVFPDLFRAYAEQYDWPIDRIFRDIQDIDE